MAVFTQEQHREALIRRRIKFVVEKGAMARLFKAGTNAALQEELALRIRPEELSRIQTRDEYDSWLLATVESSCWEPDPLLCTCGGRMRIVSFITDPRIVDRILRHCASVRPKRRIHLNQGRRRFADNFLSDGEDALRRGENVVRGAIKMFSVPSTNRFTGRKS